MSTLIIAEAGVNHNGNIQLAKKLIEVAAESRVNIVKFQTFQASRLVTTDAKKAHYQSEFLNESDKQIEMLQKLELDKQQHVELIELAKNRKIEFLSTGFDIESLKMLISLGINRIKIPSGEITNLPFLRFVANQNKKIILSTGMSTLKDIESALTILFNGGVKKDDLTVLHCTTNYPTKMNEVNLNAMLTIGREFGVNYGYSDHTLGIEVSIAAVALGAVVIEKHFTLDRNLPGPDHKASLEPSELAALVDGIRNIEVAMGNGVKTPTNSELSNMNVTRKSIVASKRIRKGDMLTEENVTAKRPASGISPMEWDSIIGSVSNKDYEEDDLITQ